MCVVLCFTTRHKQRYHLRFPITHSLFSGDSFKVAVISGAFSFGFPRLLPRTRTLIGGRAPCVHLCLQGGAVVPCTQKKQQRHSTTSVKSHASRGVPNQGYLCDRRPYHPLNIPRSGPDNEPTERETRPPVRRSLLYLDQLQMRCSDGRGREALARRL